MDAGWTTIGRSRQRPPGTLPGGQGAGRAGRSGALAEQDDGLSAYSLRRGTCLQGARFQMRSAIQVGVGSQGSLRQAMKKYLLIGVSAFVLGAGSMAYVSQHAQAAATPRANTYRMLGLFGDVLDTVERQYVTPVDDTK